MHLSDAGTLHLCFRLARWIGSRRNRAAPDCSRRVRVRCNCRRYIHSDGARSARDPGVLIRRLDRVSCPFHSRYSGTLRTRPVHQFGTPHATATGFAALADFFNHKARPGESLRHGAERRNPFPGNLAVCAFDDLPVTETRISNKTPRLSTVHTPEAPKRNERLRHIKYVAASNVFGFCAIHPNSSTTTEAIRLKYPQTRKNSTRNGGCG